MKPIFDLTNTVALITGAGRGIGKTLAFGLANAGADVVLLARTESEIVNSAKEIAEETGVKTLPIICDVTSGESIKNSVAQVISEWGKIDILINNAGSSVRKTIADITEPDWDYVMDMNLKSVFLMSQAVGKYMLERKYGRVINIASVASVLTLASGTPYGPSKAGVVQFTRQLANEWATSGITVNAISPWFFKTSLNEKALESEDFRMLLEKRTPMKRLGRLEELVAPIIMFSSAEASYITGQNLFVDGGVVNYAF